MGSVTSGGAVKEGVGSGKCLIKKTDEVVFHRGLDLSCVDVLQVLVGLGSCVVCEDLLLGGRVVVPSEVGDLDTGEHLDRGGLSASVRSEETGDDTLLGDGQPVETEHVLSVLVHHLALQLIGETDDLDGIELTFVNTDSATLTKCLGDDGLTPLTEGDTLRDSRPHEGTEVDTLLVAFPVLASIVKDRGYPHDASNRELINKHSVARIKEHLRPICHTFDIWHNHVRIYWAHFHRFSIVVCKY